ncbi:uracil-DNA glycosylase family protein [Streptococcus sp. S784/96/1]|uniref:uracil-DNA glycosylase family protein n=1 Tax=Streptococcus sp. S784/96/1 TaxID=2653499 RepID=UPI001389BDB9|nr:uracil-DNA glycosylase family protein [Streptococcus sp. S784/96/1]
MKTLEDIISAIMADPNNQTFTERGIIPLVAAPKTAKIVIVGQAPGSRAEATGMYFNDPSGDNLREWLGIDREMFYNSGLIAVVPMDFYFPGTGKSGDLPPRQGFAEKWHAPMFDLMPEVELVILIGKYAQQYYLNQPKSAKLTDTVRHFQDFLPRYFPLVHPSPRNNIWQKKNPWFKETVLPELRNRVAEILGNG